MDKPLCHCGKPARSYRSKLCSAHYNQEWRHQNPEKNKATLERFAKKHPKAASKAAMKWRAKNKKRWQEYLDRTIEARNEQAKKWFAKNPGKKRQATHKSDSFRKNSCVRWAEKEIIDLIYAEAEHRNLVVDHIIPIKGKLVCGLHVYNNLQLLTKRANTKKGFKFDPFNPNEHAVIALL